MKACSNIVAACAVVVVVMVLLLGEANVSVNAATCNRNELSVCRAEIISSSHPSQACCSKIKEQQPCLCQYLQDPNNNGNFDHSAKRVAKECGVAIPNC